MPTANEPPLTAAELLAQAHAANIRRLRATPLPDSSYVCEYNKYKAWVRTNRERHALDAALITRKNIDAYYVHEVVSRDGKKNTVGRILWALQWFSDYRERPAEGFVVKSATTKTCVSVQQAQYKAGTTGDGKAGTDPHKGLKDVLPESDRRKLLTHIYGVRNDWAPASFGFTWGHNAAVRGHSSRKFVLCDLKTSRGFGPDRDGPTSRTLMLVLRRGSVHKDNFITDKQISCWRHRDYLLCSTFATSLQLVYKLKQLGDDINCYHLDKKERCPWWDIPLIQWTTYDGKLIFAGCLLCSTALY